jgi:hypothetical protein
MFPPHHLPPTKTSTNKSQLNLRTYINDLENTVEIYEEEEYPMSPLHSCFAHIPSLTNLTEVSLKFTKRVSNPERDPQYWDEWGTESIALRTKVLRNLFGALDTSKLGVETLSIENLQDYSPELYDTPAFQRVRSKIKSLHLKIAMEYTGEIGRETDADLPERHVFFGRDLNEHWLTPL